LQLKLQALLFKIPLVTAQAIQPSAEPGDFMRLPDLSQTEDQKNQKGHNPKNPLSGIPAGTGWTAGTIRP
jgi:hypothetical protein